MSLRTMLPMLAALISLPAAAYELQTDSEGDVVQWHQAMNLVVDEGLAQALGREAVARALGSMLTQLRDAAPGMTFDATIGAAPEHALGYRAGEKNVNAVIGLADWPYTQSNLAVTLITLDTRTNEILDTDVLFNVSRHALAVLPDDEVHYDRGFDLQNALTHELGHALGLSHNDADESLVMFSSTFPGELTKRVLKDDDRAGLRALYGAGPLASGAGVTGPELDAVPVAGCSAAGQAPLLLLGLLGLLRARRRGATAAVAASAALLGGAAFAAEPAADPLRDADAVSVARVVDRVSAAHPAAPGVLYTRLTLITSECLKGVCRDMTAAVVWGGRVGELEQIVAHEPVPPLGATVLVTRRGATVGVVASSTPDLLEQLARLRGRATVNP